MELTEIKFADLDITKYAEMRTWCRDQFGREALWVEQLQNPNSISIWYTQGDYPKEQFSDKRVEQGRAVFKFKDKNDASFFALKWS
jgi:hypothetical protein